MDIYAPENEPEIHEWATVYLVKIPFKPTHPTRTAVYVEVDEYGVISIHPYAVWSGHKPKTHQQLMEIYEWLVEWELAEWKAIGPEDSELFATEKLHRK
jgi:hypothetical protein